MKRLALALLALVGLHAPLHAQDARSMGMGFAVSAVPMGVLGLVWNPSFLGMPTLDGLPEPWTLATGYSVLDSSNTGGPILRYDDQKALASGKDPARRGLFDRGTVLVRYINAGGGVVYDRSLTSSTTRDALKFFRDRQASFTDTSYSLGQTVIDRTDSTLVLGYGTPLPFGTIPVFIGGNLKYHMGFSYSRTLLKGTFEPGTVPSGSFQYDRFTSSSGLGLSGDFGFFGKLTDALQIGMMFENIKSDFNWEGRKTSFSLDPTTGAETATGPAQDVTLQDPYPYAVKLGLSAAPPEKNIVLSGEVEWKGGRTKWSGGLERYYPEVGLVVRMGTFPDEVSNEQIWCFGGGYYGKGIVVDIAFLARSLPAIQDSLALGGAINAALRF